MSYTAIGESKDSSASHADRLPVGIDPHRRLFDNMKRRTIPGMDGLRGIAALTVVLFHGTNQHFPGRQAVQMFFVLSGLLVTWLLSAEEQRAGAVNLKAFYLRRAFRLFPALAALLVWETLTDMPHVTVEGMTAAAFYYANYASAKGADLLGLVHTWSLSVEEHFYLIWPAIFVFTRNRRQLIRALFWIALASFAYRLLASKFIGLNYAGNATECNTSGLALGCALAMIIWKSPQALPRFLLYPLLTPISIIAIFGLAQVSVNAQITWAITASVPFAAVLLLQAVTYEWRILENPVARYLGRISYGIYLWHLVGFAILREINIPEGLAPYLQPFAVIAVASVSYFLIERPLQSMGKIWIAHAAEKVT